MIILIFMFKGLVPILAFKAISKCLTFTLFSLLASQFPYQLSLG